MEETADRLESMIVMALCANHGDYCPGHLWKDKSTGAVRERFDIGQLLRFDEMRPSSFYTIDMTDHDRLFAFTPDYLITHPADVLGEESEVAMIDGEELLWFGYRRMRRQPKGVSCLGRAAVWYEVHHRVVTVSGNGAYVKRCVPLDKDGWPLLARMQGQGIGVPQLDGETLISAASIIEDANRSGAMLATVKDAREIMFPVPIADYKKVFADREGPKIGDRRKAIVHWVARHLRKSTRGNECVVNKHLRGVQEFSVDGLLVRLTPNGA